mgnify:CR=1 FL=1
MSAGATLLKLQQIDLKLARNKSELANMPELKELASKRKTYVKLKAEMTKLYAQRKDLDIELDDLNTTEIQTNNAIEAAKKRHVDGSDYREVQDLENELATLAKRLDKIEHTRKDVVVAHKEALDREARAQAIIAKFEEGVKAALESKAEIVVVCAADDDYAEAAPKVKELLGGKAILVVAGAPACMPELEAQGITNFINVKSNVLETLKFYLKEMGI